MYKTRIPPLKTKCPQQDKQKNKYSLILGWADFVGVQTLLILNQTSNSDAAAT